MKIDRTNYEIWFIDWMDGKLTSSQQEQLELFLRQNPDLEEELSEYSSPAPIPASGAYGNKKALLKSSTELPLSQFEYLCAAWMENDLDSGQRQELEDIVHKNPDKAFIFGQMCRTRLTPEKVVYKRKKLLLKDTLFRKVIRLSEIGFGSAAAIALVLVAWYFLHGSPSPKTYKTADHHISESGHNVPSPAAKSENAAAKTPATDSGSEKVRQAGVIKEKYTIHSEKNDLPSEKNDLPSPAEATEARSANKGVEIKKLALTAYPELSVTDPANSLTAPPEVPENGAPLDERSQVGKFISRTFREKLLREKTPDERPLKGYEIAEAGVAGLNKLFDWQMAMGTNNDENGQPKSIYFRSKILKVKLPVKKREELP